MKRKLYTNISFKGTATEKRYITLAANLRGMSVGELVRAAVVSYSKSDLEKFDIYVSEDGSLVNQNGK